MIVWALILLYLMGDILWRFGLSNFPNSIRTGDIVAVADLKSSGMALFGLAAALLTARFRRIGVELLSVIVVFSCVGFIIQLAGLLVKQAPNRFLISVVLVCVYGVVLVPHVYCLLWAKRNWIRFR